MTMRQTIAATACAITFGLLTASTVSAQNANPVPCHKCDYHTAAPSPNPHDLMPKIIKVPCPPELMGDCLKTGK